jgi:hypothetical protein
MGESRGWLRQIGAVRDGAKLETSEQWVLGGPDDANRSRRLDWSKLMRRSWGIDVLHCPTCGGKMDLIAVIEDATIAAKILTHLGLPARPPPRGRPFHRAKQHQLALDIDHDFQSLAVS